MFTKEVQKIIKRLQTARIALMKKQPFYAVLLLHMQFSLDSMCETLYTDGERIAFCPDFLESLSDGELEFVLMHEILHVALNHCNRKMKDYDFDDFGTACDIIVNSNILFSCNNDLSAITLKEYGESMHIAPDGKEGYYHTVEEVYRMIQKIRVSQGGKSKKKGPGSGDGEKGSKRKERGSDGKDGEPLDEETDEKSEELSDIVRKDGGFDDHTFWEEDEESGETASDVQELWIQRMIEAAQIAEQIQEREKGSRSCGKIPSGACRVIGEYTRPQTDWRTVLDMFVQEEITDYSFNPPDRRFQDSPFLLPDYNEKEDSVKDILFMIDTSGSMSGKMITQAYSEIKGAIEQFDGHLSGWLGFFDAQVVPAKPFESEEEFRIIRAEGGGGTSFHCIFEYVQNELKHDFEPVSIVILTDGYASFPEKEEAMGIPVLWIINNDEVDPPWGKVARIQIT